MIIRCRDPLRYGAQTPQESGSSESKALVVVEFISSILCLPLHPYWSIMNLFSFCFIFASLYYHLLLLLLLFCYIWCAFFHPRYLPSIIFFSMDSIIILFPFLNVRSGFPGIFFFIMDDMAIFLFFLFIPRLILFKF